MTYLLETNAIGDLMRESLAIQAHAAAIAPGDGLITCVIVVGEVEFGIERMSPGRRSSGHQTKAAQILAPLRVEPVSPVAAKTFAHIRATSLASGRSVGDNDPWIAAVAITLGATLVTRDADFSAVPGLKLADWSRP